MATIRAYTTVEQSRKLAEILPLESADMSYHHFVPDLLPEGYCISTDKVKYETDIPCWSLSALLSALPKHIGSSVLRMDMSENDFNLWFEDLSGTVDEILPDITKYNPVDACYELILKLHELKML